MSFSVPKLRANGRAIYHEEKQPLPDGARCLVCFETDPAKYANCTAGDCYPLYAQEREAPTGFVAARPMVSAFELAAGMRAKALRLDWDQDELRTKLLARARELQTGDSAEVPAEDY